MRLKKQIFLKNEDETVFFASKLAKKLRKGDVLGLKGDLGSGKTTLARALIRSLTQNPTLEVPSPTFTLIQSYDGCEKIHHLDLYRLESPEEIDELGLDDFLTEGIALIEWPERAQKKLPEENIRIEFFHEEEGRHLLLTFMDSEQKRFLAI